jgi:hypothetical protein
MRLSFLVPLPLLLAGCGSESYKTAHVSGKVTLNKKVLANAYVTFQPVATEANKNPGPGSGGKTDSDGRFTLTLTAPDRHGSGAVVGKHKVRITLAPDGDTADDRPKKFKQLPAKYSGKTTTLECDVPASGTDAANFDLTDP